MPRHLPMFPLGTVLLPHMVLPLHIFEPRYRVLMHDVLDGDREFGVVLITRGHEVGGGDHRTAVGTVARLVKAEETEDGRWLAISVGTERFTVTDWLEDAPYPHAEVEALPDEPCPRDDVALRTAVEPLGASLRRVLGLSLELGNDGVPPDVELADDPHEAAWQIAVFAPLTPFDAQQVLELPHTAARLDALAELLDHHEALLRFHLEGGTDPPAVDG